MIKAYGRFNLKLEKINGEQFIILEDNDKVCLKEMGKNSITIAEDNAGIKIFGDSTLVNSISGKGMLEKVYIPPVISSEDIISKCDEWLEMFKQVHDVFKKLVLSEKYRNQKIVMHLSFQSFVSFSDSKIKGNTICLDLKQYAEIIQTGVKITVDEINSDIYAYLMANALAYYISKNYNNTQIDYLDYNWDYTLYSDNKVPKGETRPLVSSLSALYDSTNYANIIIGLLRNHNLGIPADQILFNLRNRIFSQQLSDSFSESLDYSSREYRFIVPDYNDKTSVVLKRDLSQE